MKSAMESAIDAAALALHRAQRPAVAFDEMTEHSRMAARLHAQAAVAAALGCLGARAGDGAIDALADVLHEASCDVDGCEGAGVDRPYYVRLAEKVRASDASRLVGALNDPALREVMDEDGDAYVSVDDLRAALTSGAAVGARDRLATTIHGDCYEGLDPLAQREVDAALVDGGTADTNRFRDDVERAKRRQESTPPHRRLVVTRDAVSAPRTAKSGTSGRPALTPHTSTQPPRVEAEDAVSAETRHGRDSARPAAVGGGE